MEHFGWTPATLEELTPEYQDMLLIALNEQAAAAQGRR